MRSLFIALILVLTGCAGPNSATAAYDAVAEMYCKQKFPNQNIAGCLLHMKTGYLTNEEINFVNEKSRWWTEREAP